MKAALVWGPVHRTLENKLQSGDEIVLLIAPYIKLEAIRRLLGATGCSKSLKVIVRWQLEDLVTGASDLEVYGFLKERGIPLYRNESIHLKLYIFASNQCFASSANVTLAGLGYIKTANFEVGNIVILTLADWEHIYRLIEGSRIVDDLLCSHFLKIIKQVPAMPKLEMEPLPSEPLKRYTIATLPATISPTALEDRYFSPESVLSQEEMRRIAHDLSIYRIGLDHSHESFRAALGQAFRTTSFVCDLIEYLRAQHSLRFGAANAWIHDKCEDVPLPYRWEIKENTRILYDWLAHFFPEITWDVPGGYSQVIYWNK